MKAANLVSAIKRMGGTAKIVSEPKHSEIQGIRREWVSHEVVGELNGYDIQMHGLDQSFWTARKVSNRGYFDAGADYNTGGYEFNHRIKDLERYNETN